MSIDLNCLRIFIASPPGMGGELKAVCAEIDRYNQAESFQRGVLFVPAGSETPFGAAGPDQTNREIEESDYFVLLLWDRWGPPREAGSGTLCKSATEEQYDFALKCQRDADLPMRDLVMMFKAVNQQQLSDPGIQLTRVLDFKKELERQKNHRADSFDTTGRCQTLIRSHLAAWAQEWANSGARVDSMEQSRSQVIPPFEGVDDACNLKAFGELERPVESLTKKAWSLAEGGHFTEAEVEFAKTVVAYEQSETLLSYALFLCGAGRLDQARILMERSVQIAEEREEAPSLAGAAINLGIVLQLAGDHAGAERTYRRSLEAAERLGLSPQVEKARWLLENLGGSNSNEQTSD